MNPQVALRQALREEKSRFDRYFNPSAYSILVIDDDLDQLDYFSTLVRDHGFKVFTANSAQEGLDLANKTYLDLLVCDLRMPGLSGIEFIERIRNASRFTTDNQIPIITLSACYYGYESTVLGSGANSYCAKQDADINLIPCIQKLLQE